MTALASTRTVHDQQRQIVGSFDPQEAPRNMPVQCPVCQCTNFDEGQRLTVIEHLDEADRHDTVRSFACGVSFQGDDNRYRQSTMCGHRPQMPAQAIPNWQIAALVAICTAIGFWSGVATVL